MREGQPPASRIRGRPAGLHSHLDHGSDTGASTALRGTSGRCVGLRQPVSATPYQVCTGVAAGQDVYRKLTFSRPTSWPLHSRHFIRQEAPIPKQLCGFCVRVL